MPLGRLLYETKEEEGAIVEQRKSSGGIPCNFFNMFVDRERKVTGIMGKVILILRDTGCWHKMFFAYVEY